MKSRRKNSTGILINLSGYLRSCVFPTLAFSRWKRNTHTAVIQTKVDYLKESCQARRLFNTRAFISSFVCGSSKSISKYNAKQKELNLICKTVPHLILTAGAPQDSIFGPLLFLLHMNISFNFILIKCKSL